MEDTTVEQTIPNETTKTAEETKTAETKGLTKAEQLRELSKEYGFDAFKPEEVKSKLEEFKEWQANQKTEHEKMQEKLAAKEAKEAEYIEQTTQLNAQIAGLKLGIPMDKLNDALALAKINMTEGQTVEDGLKIVQEKYKAMFVKGSGVTVQVGTQMRDNENNDNKQTDPAVARYLARKNKK